MKKRLRSWSCSLFGLLLCPALLSTATTAVGQNITVNTSVTHDVYGNGLLSNTGAWDLAWDNDPTTQPSPNSHTVTINSGGSVTGRAVGGYKWSYAAANFTVSGNGVSLNGGTVSTDVYGGWAYNKADINNATATSNTVTISGGTVGNSVYGGYSQSVAGVATVNKNTVTISGGAVGADVRGGYAFTSAGGPATASENKVSISDETVGGAVTGGHAENSGGGGTSPGAAKAELNTVTMNGGTVTGDVNGGYTFSWTGAVQANNNEVTINGSTVNGSVYGGQALSNGLAATVTATANGNTVNISGTAHVDGDVFGGGAYSRGNDYMAPNASTATGNIVNISGTPTFGAGAVLYGGDVTGEGDSFTGNTLNLHSANITVGELGYFQFLNFYVPTDAVNGSTMLHVTGTALLSENADGSGRQATVNVGIDGASSPLKAGDKINLIEAGTLTGTPANTASKGEGMQGVTLKYEFDIKADNAAGLLTATVTSVEASDQSESPGQGFLSGMGLLNQGSDLIAGLGMAAAVDAANRPNLGSYGLGLFGVAAAGSSRYATGSSVDVSGISLMAGIAKRINMQPGNLMVGAFFEYGNGSYDTYSTFHHGDGDLDHFGGGLIGRFDLAGSKTGHFYTEGSLRIGNINNDFGGLYDSLGQEARYDSSSTYYGIHLGSGYIWNLTDKASLDFYARYFWTQQKGDTVRLTTGDPVDFDNVNSHRMRIGTRFAYAANASLSPYVGVAYEHEFDGEARATRDGTSLKAPSIDGGTGVGELGLTFKPSAAVPISLDLGAQGYVGTREGVTGTLHLRYEF